MPKEEKPYLKKWTYIGIHTLQPIAETEFWNPTHNCGLAEFFIHGVRPSGGKTIEPVEGNFYRLPASHVVTLCSDEWAYCFSELTTRRKSRKRAGEWEDYYVPDGVDYANPNQDVAMMFWGRRKLLGRNPGATFIYHEDHLYHILTWLDVIGKNSKESRMQKVRDNRLVVFAQQRTPEETKFLIELFHKEKPTADHR